MATYEYICKKCDLVIEKIVSMNSNKEVRCPEDNTKMKRVFSTPSIVYRGDGWAKKDRRRDE
jgi:putative FmdB family regulatory protein